MAASVSPSSSSPAPPADAFAVFVDTTLDTRFAMLVSPTDTVADLKGQIRMEHSLCFPDVGDISVLSLKAKRRGSFYHLCDSMLVQSAFSGIKGTWFLFVDVVCTGHQVETTKNKMNYPLFGMRPNASSLGRDASMVPEKQRWPTTCPQMLSFHNSLPLPHAGGSYNNHPVSDDSNVDALVYSRAKAPCGNHSMFLIENNKKSVADELELQASDRAVEVAVESHTEPGSGHVRSSDKKDIGVKLYGHLVDKANDENVSTKKEKSRKKSTTGCNDQLVDEDDLAEKKTHKKGKDDPSKEPVADPKANSGTHICNKEVSLLENVHPESITPLQDDPLQKDLTTNEKKKKKKRKKEASTKHQYDINFAIPESRLIETNADLSMRNQDDVENAQEAFMKKHKNLGEETDALVFSDNATGNVIGGVSVEFGSINPLSLKYDGSNHNGTISNEALSIHEFAKQGQLTDADPQGSPVDKIADQRKSCDASTTVQEVAPERHSAEVGTHVLNISLRSKKHKSGSSRNKNTSLHAFGDHVNEDNLQVSGNNKKELRRENDIMGNIIEAGDHIHNTEGILVVPSDPDVQDSRGRRRKKSHKITEIINSQSATSHEAVLSSGNQASEKSFKGTSNDQFKDSNKQSKDSTVGEAAILGIHALDDSGVPSNPSDRNSRGRRKKKSTKAELPTYGCIEKEHAHSFMKETTEKSPEEILVENCKRLAEKSKPGIIIGEAAVGEISASRDSTFHANLNDKNSLRRRKKTTKAELPNHDSVDERHAHSLIKTTTEESGAETFEDSCREQSEKSQSATVFAEAGNRESEILTYPFNSNDSKSWNRKKLTNHDIIGKEPMELIDYLVKEETTESPIVSLQDSLKEQGKEVHSATFLGEAARSLADVYLPNPDDNNYRSQKKRKAKANFSCYSTSSYDLAHSSEKLSPQENSEKALGTTRRGSHSGSDSGTPDKTIQNLVYENPVDADLCELAVGLRNKQDFVQQSTEEAAEESKQKERAAKSIEANGRKQLPKSGTDKINFAESFVPKAVRHKAHALRQEHSSFETESRKFNEEKTNRRKRKSNMRSENSTHDLANQSSLYELKEKPQDDDPSNLDLVNPLVLRNEEPETKRGKKAMGRISDFGVVGKLNDNRVEQEPQVSNSDTHHEISLSNDVQSKNLKGKTFAVSKRKLKSIPDHEGHDILIPMSGVQQPIDFDADMRSSPLTEPVSQNFSTAGAEISLEETMSSSDSMEENMPSGKYRVAVRKVPSSSFGNKFSGDVQQKTLLATAGTIFDDGMGENSEDGNEVYNRKYTSKPFFDSSFSSEDSDMGFKVTQKGTCLKAHANADSPGVPSAENEEATDEVILSQSKGKRSMSLSRILRNTSSYRKAKLAASLSQVEDSESQPVDVVPESQL